MFTFTDRYEFDWPVRVKYPSAEGEVVHEFTARFVMPQDELEIFEKVKAEGAAEMITIVRERLARYWIGWSGIAVEGGGELKFSAEARDNMLRQRAIRIAVDEAISDAVLGIRQKN